MERTATAVFSFVKPHSGLRLYGNLSDYIYEAAEKVATAKLKEEGYSWWHAIIPFSGYLRRRSKLHDDAEDEIREELDGMYLDGIVSASSEGFTAVGKTNDEAIENGKMVKESIEAILRKRHPNIRIEMESTYSGPEPAVQH